MPMGPDVGERVDIDGFGMTVNLTPLLELVPTFTTTFPVVAVGGTVATMALLPHVVIAVAGTPLNVTVLVP
jgi:hypothetical protein